MKNIKEKKCKNCKGRGFVPMGEGRKGLTQCPVCLGSGIIKKDSDVEKDKEKPEVQRRELSFNHQVRSYVGE